MNLTTSCLGRRAVILVAVLAILSGTVGAQGFKWWKSDEYRRELGLTEDQSRRLEEIFQTALPTLRVNKKAFDQEEKTFERLMGRGDDELVIDQVSRVEAARAELNKSRTMMLLKMRRVLTSDQWIKFSALHEATQREHEASKNSDTSTKSKK